MSIIITACVPEGIVTASDSRITTRTGNADELLTISDEGKKIFVLNNEIVIACWGELFINKLPVSSYMEEFVNEFVSEPVDVAEVPGLLLEFFGEPFNHPNISFHVTGYSRANERREQCCFYVNANDKTNVQLNRFNEEELFYSVFWGGENNIMPRLLNTVKMKNRNEWTLAEPDMIPFSMFNLDDAIRFVKLSMNTSLGFQEFQQKRNKPLGGNIQIKIVSKYGGVE